MNLKQKSVHLFIFFVLITAGCALATIEKDMIGTRPESWAKPMNIPGLPNLHQVSDSVYRGARPTAEGISHLKKMGIKTVINLRSLHSDQDEIGDTGLAYVHIPMKAWHVKEKDVVKFLQITTNKDCTPVFVHCKHGADRTGVMIAAYRLAVCGWNKQEAISEMTRGGFGYHKIWKNLITFIEKLDIEKIKKKTFSNQLSVISYQKYA
ncbi:fused DSP-PTPase phosphatase/NAD kinase-like protein [Desulfonema magnum]|uniref:Tyrosine phosphatase domain-containing n=1 Tax=Desulfonema magnum TaxID=45655 RepID=A0A975BLM9_9BACT|nr:dual specificity protein phosphatase family protein [Desulfonema magnum]QTA87408.1 Tyrosine phosphatase domain-containing [Desulfonema magnum]